MNQYEDTILTFRNQKKEMGYCQVHSKAPTPEGQTLAASLAEPQPDIVSRNLATSLWGGSHHYLHLQKGN